MRVPGFGSRIPAQEPEHPRDVCALRPVPQPSAYWDTAWHTLTGKAGFPGLRFHDLRHTFITHVVERGVSLGVIQTFIGHLSARMLQNYTHIASGTARKAVELLDSDPILTPAISKDAQVHYA